MKSNKRITSPTLGVQHPVAEDAALYGDTRHELRVKPLIHRGGSHGKEVLSIKGLSASDNTGQVDPTNPSSNLPGPPSATPSSKSLGNSKDDQ